MLLHCHLFGSRQQARLASLTTPIVLLILLLIRELLFTVAARGGAERVVPALLCTANSRLGKVEWRERQLVCSGHRLRRTLALPACASQRGRFLPTRVLLLWGPWLGPLALWRGHSARRLPRLQSGGLDPMIRAMKQRSEGGAGEKKAAGRAPMCN